MHVLIVFGTTEGHTREVAQYAARCLREAGHAATVEPAPADPAHPDPSAFDAVLLAASLHVGNFQPALVQYARAHHAALTTRPSAFISVSLAAAGANPHDWEGLEQCLARFEHETLWKPAKVHHAAGAIRYSQYDFFKRLALKYIAARRGKRTVTSQDYDFTDYDALKAFVLEFAQSAHATPAANPAPT